MVFNGEDRFCRIAMLICAVNKLTSRSRVLKDAVAMWHDDINEIDDFQFYLWKRLDDDHLCLLQFNGATSIYNSTTTIKPQEKTTKQQRLGWYRKWQLVHALQEGQVRYTLLNVLLYVNPHDELQTKQISRTYSPQLRVKYSYHSG